MIKRDAETGKFIRGNRCNLFKKGNKPWNKNLKGLHLSPKTEFKNGNYPQTYKGKDHIQKIKNQKTDKLEYYKSYRDEKNKPRRTTYARYLWLKNKGYIPKGWIVYNSNEPNLPKFEDLRLITRAELLKINREKRK